MAGILQCVDRLSIAEPRRESLTKRSVQLRTLCCQPFLISTPPCTVAFVADSHAQL